MWIIIIIILFLIFGRNLNLGASLTSVIQNAHQSPLSSPAGTTPGIPGPSGYGTTFNAPNMSSIPTPIATSPAPIAPTPFSPAPTTVYSATPAQQTVPAPVVSFIRQSPAAGATLAANPTNPSEALFQRIFGGRSPAPAAPVSTATPVAPIRVVSEAPLPVTGIAGRQTSVPENGGTFFRASRFVTLG